MKHFTLISTFTLLLGSSAAYAELGAQLKTAHKVSHGAANSGVVKNTMSHQTTTLLFPAGALRNFSNLPLEPSSVRGFVPLSNNDAEEPSDCSSFDNNDPCANSPPQEEEERREPAADPADQAKCFDNPDPCSIPGKSDDEITTPTAN
jgi:hypothetical protein